jgi:hypothetical protein
MLLLWPPATLLVYVALSPSVPGHALEGLSLPLAVLAARGAQRLGAPMAVAVAAGVVLTVPGLVKVAEFMRDRVGSHEQVWRLVDGERDALRFVERASGPGGVLTSAYLGAAVPAHTGRQVWVGHPSWTPTYAVRAERADALFEGRLGADEARMTVAESGVRFLISDCRADADLGHVLAPDVIRTRRFGCAKVYEVKRP